MTDTSRLRWLRSRVSPRMWAAILASLGITTGGVVIVNRDRPRQDPPPVVVVDPPSQPPPVTPPPSGDYAPEQFWEHSLYGNAPGDLTLRDCTFGPDWPTKPTAKYSMWGESGNYAGSSLAATEWGAWGGTGLAHAVMNMNGPIQSGVTFTDCAWLASPHPDGSPSSMRWGVRGFGLMGVTFDRCSFSRGMGAGVQVALRAKEAHGNIAPQGTHRYERCTFVGIGDPRSERWGAFTISEHNPEGYGVDAVPVGVEIINCTLIGGHLDWTDPNGNRVRSPRGILIQGRYPVVIRGLDLRYPDPYESWALQLWDIDDGDPSTVDLIIEDGFIEAGRVEIRNCGQVVVRNMNGGAYIAAGTHANKLKPFPMETVAHQGPVTAGYAQ